MADKFGIDEDLEKLANEWLYRGVGDNKRSEDRFREKLSHELGLIGDDELRLYDPVNDWDTLESAYTLYRSDLDGLESDICAVDGNVRHRHDELQERRSLTRHVEDDDGWGSVTEDIPILGIFEEGVPDRKTCTRCGRSKGLGCFSPLGENGYRFWCKACERRVARERNTRK